jgi:hypothetical protein
MVQNKYGLFGMFKVLENEIKKTYCYYSPAENFFDGAFKPTWYGTFQTDSIFRPFTE